MKTQLDTYAAATMIVLLSGCSAAVGNSEELAESSTQPDGAAAAAEESAPEPSGSWHSGHDLSGGTGEMFPEPEAEPSGNWYIGHSMSLQGLAELGWITVSAVDFASGSPVGNATVCAMTGAGASCESTDEVGRVELGVQPLARTIAATAPEGYVETYLTLTAPAEPVDLSEAEYALYTPESLDALYRAAGVERDAAASTLVLSIAGSAEGTRVFLETAGELEAALYAGPGGLPSSELETASAIGTAYFLNVASGNREIVFENDLAGCRAHEVRAWSGGAPDRIATLAGGGAVTHAGTIECSAEH